MEITADKSEIGSAPWTVEGLIEAAERIMAAEPRLFSHPDSDTGKELNVRLIRDYVVREFIPRPERVGRESRFGRNHLIWLLAVRALLRSQRWSLPAIKASFSSTSTEELLDGLLAPVHSRIETEYRKATLQVLEKAVAAAEPVTTPELNPAQLLIKQFKEERSPAAKEPHAPLFSRSAASGKPPAALEQLRLRTIERLKGRQESVKEKTHIEIEPGCEVVIDAQRMRSLTPDEVERLGEALKRHLCNKMAR